MLIRYPQQLGQQSIIIDSYQNVKSQRKNMHIYKAMPLKLQKEITPIVLAPSSSVFMINICLEDRNVFASLEGLMKFHQ